MVVNCEEVWREISNYLEDEIDPGLRTAMDEHIRGCKRCTAVLEGTRNVVQLYGDERMVEVPLGYSYRLRRRLEENMNPSRRTFFGWMVAAAAAVAATPQTGCEPSSGSGRTIFRNPLRRPFVGQATGLPHPARPLEDASPEGPS